MELQTAKVENNTTVRVVYDLLNDTAEAQMLRTREYTHRKTTVQIWARRKLDVLAFRSKAFMT